MNAIQALMYVNIAIWFGFGGYCFFLAKKQGEIEKRLLVLTLHDSTENDD